MHGHHAAMGRGRRALAGVAVHDDRSRHEVLADAPTRRAAHDDPRSLAEAADVVPGRTVDFHRDVGVEPDGQVVLPARREQPHRRTIGEPLQGRIDLADAELGQIEFQQPGAHRTHVDHR